MRKQNLIQKRWLLPLCCVLTVLAVFMLFFLFSGVGEEEIDPSSEVFDVYVPVSSEQQTEQVLRGVIEDALMSTIVVAGEDGNHYIFDQSGAAVQTGEYGILIGNPVTVYYYGELSPGDQTQPVEVTAIIVENNPLVKAREQELLETMTLEEKVGQMFIARCPDVDAVLKIQEYHLGGYILFARDFENSTMGEAKEKIRSFQDTAALPMLIGVDEEGGSVTRVSKFPAFRDKPFSSPQKVFADGGWEAVRADTREKCALLQELGINLNFAPVCDISENPDDFIYARSFGKGASETAEYIKTVVETMREQKMGAVLKHFPGYGSNGDTHTDIVYDERPYETFLSSDFLPFRAGIEEGAEAVLVSHNIVKSIDPEYPASLSPKVHEILREELGFSGVILTDDLAMDGVGDFAGKEETAVLAVQAGNDLLCCSDFEIQIPAVIKAVQNGTISESRIDESVLRILRMKKELGMLDV